jgi:hypothetical protein
MWEGWIVMLVTNNQYQSGMAGAMPSACAAALGSALKHWYKGNK